VDTALRGISAGRPRPGARGRPIRATRIDVRRHRWLRRSCDYAVRIATIAAGLCPALSSLGGALVGALLAATVAVALAEPR
jgi:hypothetical protein